MTFAWYAHLKELNNKPWIIAAFVSWGIALLEYLLQVPAENITGSHYLVDFCAVFGNVFKRTPENGLFVGGIVPCRGSIFYVSQ
jgi:uncharacterized protein (DUF486 family)